MNILIIAILNVNSIRGCCIFPSLSSIMFAFYLYVVRNGEVNGLLIGGQLLRLKASLFDLLAKKKSWSLYCPYMTVVTSVNHYTQLNRNFFLLASTQKQVLLLNKKCTMQKDVSRKKICLHTQYLYKRNIFAILRSKYSGKSTPLPQGKAHFWFFFTKSIRINLSTHSLTLCLWHSKVLKGLKQRKLWVKCIVLFSPRVPNLDTEGGMFYGMDKCIAVYFL